MANSCRRRARCQEDVAADTSESPLTDAGVRHRGLQQLAPKLSVQEQDRETKKAAEGEEEEDDEEEEEGGSSFAQPRPSGLQSILKIPGAINENWILHTVENTSGFLCNPFILLINVPPLINIPPEILLLGGERMSPKRRFLNLSNIKKIRHN